MKPWVLEVNCLPSLSSSSIFDKQVKTQLMSDTFTLVGFRGYDKSVVRKNKKDGEPQIEEPVFAKSMEMHLVEKLGGCKS